jgi:hypothetical protein
METGHEPGFVVFVRNQYGSPQAPETAEQPIYSCASYEEARHWQRAIQGSHHECVIRYVGEVGGGD